MTQRNLRNLCRIVLKTVPDQCSDIYFNTTADQTHTVASDIRTLCKGACGQNDEGLQVIFENIIRICGSIQKEYRKEKWYSDIHDATDVYTHGK
jgi:hypothetical protein